MAVETVKCVCIWNGDDGRTSDSDAKMVGKSYSDCEEDTYRAHYLYSTFLVSKRTL